ncbi:hypothetical protein WA026_022130, partial [Henosepilachna vigintioctopunctata]
GRHIFTQWRQLSWLRKQYKDFIIYKECGPNGCITILLLVMRRYPGKPNDDYSGKFNGASRLLSKFTLK